MKNSISKLTSIFAGIICCLALFSCAGIKPQLATVKAPVKQNEIVVSDNLKTFLAKNKTFSVVLRTPNRSDNITMAQREQDIVYKELEKALIAAGFDVKDRASVDNVLKNISTTAKDSKGDVFDYAQIGKLLNVDMFIEITSLSFNEPFNQYTYKMKATGVQQELKDTNNVLNTAYAQFSFRLVIAETGSVGGMYTIYQQRCTEGCDFYVINRKVRATQSLGLFGYNSAPQPQSATLFQMPDQFGSDKAYRKANWKYEGSEKEAAVAAYFATQLINALKNK
jgi:hypothetical protein